MIWSHDLRMEVAEKCCSLQTGNNSYENWLQQFVNFIINPSGEAKRATFGNSILRMNEWVHDIKFHGAPGTKTPRFMDKVGCA